MPKDPLGPAHPQTVTGDHFVEDKEDIMVPRDGTDLTEVVLVGEHGTDIPEDRFEDESGDILVPGKGVIKG